MSKENKLTGKQQKFVDEYLIDLNATQAAIRAGYSEKNADKIGSQLLGKTRVMEAIDAKRKRLEVKSEITAEKVLQEYAKVAFSNIADFVDWSNGQITIIPSEKLTREQTACVAEVSESTSNQGTTVKFKLHDKLTALHRLGDHLGLFKKIVEMSGKDGKPLQTQQMPILNPEKLSKLNAEQLAVLEQVLPALFDTTDTGGES